MFAFVNDASNTASAGIMSIIAGVTNKAKFAGEHKCGLIQCV